MGKEAPPPLRGLLLALALLACDEPTPPPAPSPSPSPSTSTAAAVVSSPSTPPPALPPPAPCVAAWKDEPAEALAARFRTRLPDVDEVTKLLRAYHCRHPDETRLVQLATSHRGRPLWGLFVGTSDADHPRPSVLLNGAHHGNEPLTTAMVLDAVAWLLEGEGDEERERILGEVAVVAVPVVNPDGYAARGEGVVSGRKNGRDNDGDGALSRMDGVDLNRNYPFRWGALGEVGSQSKPLARYYRGPSAASEPETKGMMSLAEREHFVASMTYHTGTNTILVPYTIPNVKSPKPNVAWDVAKHVTKHQRRHPEGYVHVQTRIYPVDGTDQDWLFHRFGTVALLVEASTEADVGRFQLGRLLDSIRSGWVQATMRYLDGPSLHGRVVDAEGRPVVAEVRLGGVELREDERWTTRCRDGRFDRYVREEGDTTITVVVPDQEPVERAVTVKGRTEVEVKLDVAVEPGRCPGLDG